MKNKSKPILYTDGSCLTTRDGAGGWAFMLCMSPNATYTPAGGVKDTTNNRMEIQAVIEGLDFYFRLCEKKRLKRRNLFPPIMIVSDSKYVINGATGWIAKWKKFGWVTSNNKKVANRDLWEELDDLLQDVDVEWEWVKAHSGNVFNDKVDELARAETASIAGIVVRSW